MLFSQLQGPWPNSHKSERYESSAVNSYDLKLNPLVYYQGGRSVSRVFAQYVGCWGFNLGWSDLKKVSECLFAKQSASKNETTGSFRRDIKMFNNKQVKLTKHGQLGQEILEGCKLLKYETMKNQVGYLTY